MKNPLRVLNKATIKKGIGEVSKIVLEHENTILTGTTITCNAIGIAITYRNSPKIHDIILVTKDRLNECEDDNAKKQIIKDGLFAMTPLMLPIIIFFSGSTAAAIINQKKSEAKIATLTAALSLAQSTISEYDLFKEEVKKEIGEKKFEEIRKEVNDQRVNTYAPQAVWRVWRDAGYEVCWIPDFDYFFPSTPDKIELAWKNIDMVFERNGRDGKGYGFEYDGNEIVSYADIIRELTKNVKDVYFEPYYGRFPETVGWEAGKIPYITHSQGSFTHHSSGMTGITIDILTPATMI